eukprot:365950-Chlamydomonas_euryale.AAC.9
MRAKREAHDRSAVGEQGGQGLKSRGGGGSVGGGGSGVGDSGGGEGINGGSDGGNIERALQALK